MITQVTPLSLVNKYALAVNRVTKRYNGKVVLDQISLRLPAGECHVLLGSSGSGKSTLLRIILGLIKADEGEVSLGQTSDTRSEPGIGYIPQDGGLFPHLTAEKNIIMVAKLAGWSREKIARRLTEISEVVQLSPELLSRFPRALSGGQRQRVSIARATFMDPPVLLLDEPLGALDPISRYDVQLELRQIFARLQKTVVLVTHDLNEARLFGDRITLMNEGRIVQEGTFDELLSKPADPFVTKFVRAQHVAPDVGPSSPGEP